MADGLTPAALVVARPRGRPRDQDSAVTRERLVGVARHLFARDGYDATTNRSIARASGITTGAIYHYFSSKAELYAAVYEEVFDRVFSAFERAVGDHRTLVGQYSAVLDAAAALNREDPTLPAFVLGAASDVQRHPELRELLRPLRRRNTMFFRGLVTAAVERGELAADVDPRGVEDLLNAVVSGLARLSAAAGDAGRHAAAVAALQRFFAGTLLNPTGPARRAQPVAGGAVAGVVPIGAELAGAVGSAVPGVAGSAAGVPPETW